MLSSLQPTKKYFVIMFLISCLLLEVFAFVIYQQSRVSAQSEDWVIHSYEVLRIEHAALVNSIDLVAAEQDYLDTGNTHFLRAYDAVLRNLNHNLDLLSRATVDSPEQQGSIAVLRDKIDPSSARPVSTSP